MTDLERGRIIALAYERAPAFDYDALPSWSAMATDEGRQFDVFARIIHIEPWQGLGQPYATSAAMRADVLRRRHLYVFAGGQPHPCRTPGDVFKGRAVHDICAHAVTGADFSFPGEVRAFIAHARLYRAAALPALAADNLGTSAFYFCHPCNVGKPAEARIWPPQKVCTLPLELWRDLL